MRMMTWLNGQLPYKRVCQVLEEIGGIQVSTSSNWRMGQVCGTALQAEQQREAARMKAQAREWSTPGGKPQPGERMGLAMDGAMMNLREEGWKEFKVGCVFEVVLKEHQDVRTGDRGMFGHAIQNSYVAHLGGPEAFGWQVWTEAQRRGWVQACDSVVIGDGAPWIWNLQAEHFYTSVAVVDWYHATEHLGSAMQLLYPEGGISATRWYNRQEEALYLGHADDVARDLNAVATQTSEQATSTIIVIGCTTRIYAIRVGQLAAAWSKVKPNNLKHVSLVPACVGAVRVLKIYWLFQELFFLVKLVSTNFGLLSTKTCPFPEMHPMYPLM